jgi:hypothetical protein
MLNEVEESHRTLHRVLSIGQICRFTEQQVLYPGMWQFMDEREEAQQFYSGHLIQVQAERKDLVLSAPKRVPEQRHKDETGDPMALEESVGLPAESLIGNTR